MTPSERREPHACARNAGGARMVSASGAAAWIERKGRPGTMTIEPSTLERLLNKALDDPLTMLTGVLAICAFLSVWLVLFQLLDARRFSKRQLRAYVFVAEVEIIGIGTDAVRAAVTIRNTGQTPAYDVTVSTAANADVTTFSPTPVGPDSSRFVLGPDGLGRRDISLHSIIGTPSALAAITNGNSALYVWGEILYRDAFGKRRHTRFRHMNRGVANWPSDNKMTVCPKGNDAD
jgi:hypothetical protein